MARGFGDREFGIVDFVVLLAAVWVAVSTWSYLAEAAGVPIWKSYFSVVVTELLALATLTRDWRRAVALRLLTGGWLIAAPYLLGFADVATVLWTYMAIGFAVSLLAVPGFAAVCALRLRVAT